MIFLHNAIIDSFLIFQTAGYSFIHFNFCLKMHYQSSTNFCVAYLNGLLSSYVIKFRLYTFDWPTSNSHINIPKMLKNSSKYRRWIISFKKFNRLRLQVLSYEVKIIEAKVTTSLVSEVNVIKVKVTTIPVLEVSGI